MPGVTVRSGFGVKSDEEEERRVARVGSESKDEIYTSLSTFSSSDYLMLKKVSGRQVQRCIS